MKKSGFFLIFGLIVFFFLFKITAKNISYTYAQSGKNCEINGGGNQIYGLSFVYGEIFNIQSGSTVCKYIISASGISSSVDYLFNIDRDGRLLIVSQDSSVTSDYDKKKYFLCNNGTWEEKTTLIEDSYCINDRDILSVLKTSKQPINFNVKSDVLLTPTPLPSPPPNTICVLKDGDFQYALEVNKKICINNVIYECVSGKLTKKITNPESEIRTGIRNNYPNYEFYEATQVKNCLQNFGTSYNLYCNKNATPVDIGSGDDLFCTTKEKVEVSESKIGSFNELEQDVYGFTCGVPKELVSDAQKNVYGENSSRCCNISRGYNTTEELQQATANLGCLIDTEFLGQPMRLICYNGIVVSILKVLGIENIVSSIQENAILKAQYATRACVEGVPLIPVSKARTGPSYSEPQLQATSQATPNKSPSDDGLTITPTPRPTIMLDGKSYVLAEGEELSLKDDCQCRIIPNSLVELCNKYFDNPVECNKCVTQNKFYSAFGCIPLDIGAFFKETLFQLMLGIAGFIALICIIYSAFQIQTSAGNVEKVKKAQELLTSCIMGLMLIIFSVFILKVIGVDILRVPGLGNLFLR